MSISYAAILGADTLSNALTDRLEIRAYSDEERSTRINGKGFIAPINPASIKIGYQNKLAGEVGLNSSGPSLTVSSSEAEVISFKLVLTDSSVFHYTGRNVHSPFNNYEVDKKSNTRYLLSTPLRALNTLGADDTVKNALSLIGTKDSMEKLSYSDIKSGVPFFNRDGHVTSAIERFLNLTTQKTLKSSRQAAYLGLVWGRVFSRPGYSKGEQKYHRQRIYPCFLKNVDISYTHFTKDGRALRAELDCTFLEDTHGGS